MKKNVYYEKRKPPNSKTFESLPDAIVEGQLMFVVGSTVVMRRDHRADKCISVCEVITINSSDEKCTITLYDNTLGQRFMFDMSNPPTLKLLS